MSEIPSALDLLSAVSQFQADPNGVTGPEDTPPRIGVVDAGYNGTGDAPVRFDGETTTGTRAYVTLQPVLAGDRVVLLPVGHTYVILGPLGTNGTGWIAVTPGSGIAGTPAVRRNGRSVFSRGAFQFSASGTLGSTFMTVGTVPAGLEPKVQYLVGVGSSLPGTIQGIVLATGEVQLRTFEPGGMAYTSSSSFSITTPWLLG